MPSSSLPDSLQDQLDQVKKIEYAIIDFAGLSRGKTFFVNSLQQPSSIRLPLDVFSQTIDGKFASICLDDGQKFNCRDQDFIVKPDQTTSCLLPWCQEPTASLIGDAFDIEDQPLSYAPRQVLKTVVDLYHEKDWQPIVAAELEFFIFPDNTSSLNSLQQTDNCLDTRLGSHRENQPYGIETTPELEAFFDQVYKACEAMNIHIETLIKEVSSGQYEINLSHGEPVSTADAVCRFKRCLREVAKRHRLCVSFMAKPQIDCPGNSMHIHQSVVDRNSGTNLFSNQQGKNTPLFLSHIGGLKKYLPELVGLILPFTNSYKRLSPYLCAPLNVEWGQDNRTLAFRIPTYKDGAYDANRRIENRVPGADCNPYIAFATSLLLGYDGMLNQLDPGPPYTANAYDLPLVFSENLTEALCRLKDSSNVIEPYIGKQFMNFFIGIKTQELATYEQQITPWESQYLNGVI